MYASGIEFADALVSPVRLFELALQYFEKNIDAGYASRHFTAVIKAIEHEKNHAESI